MVEWKLPVNLTDVTCPRTLRPSKRTTLSKFDSFMMTAPRIESGLAVSTAKTGKVGHSVNLVNGSSEGAEWQQNKRADKEDGSRWASTWTNTRREDTLTRNHLNIYPAASSHYSTASMLARDPPQLTLLSTVRPVSAVRGQSSSTICP